MDDSTQHVRSHVIGQIREILFDLPPDVVTGTMRILGDTPNSILDPNNYLESIRPFASEVQDGLHQYNRNNTTRFLAVTIYPGKHSYFVVDLNNTDYDYQTAHECKTPVPVYVLRLSKRKPTIFRKRELDGQIAETLRVMHNNHGQDPLSLFDN
ncbi:uncharacterized protein N7518_005441 [Penicillium psychrosexuale]|uniref:uncharacterized protein n=1 Tax=Penicillium psychrosexuale TaxID=1002107 RepID=UPI00254586C3|nr:uncharacterized protein N7518_005441 [Penicillium psychrosexuale]KAJ5796901.1 hypothetical protein N7518_005441 [Penicillium psychrosexuale]